MEVISVEFFFDLSMGIGGGRGSARIGEEDLVSGLFSGRDRSFDHTALPIYLSIYTYIYKSNFGIYSVSYL
jgi:hypothetical protein